MLVGFGNPTEVQRLLEFVYIVPSDLRDPTIHNQLSGMNLTPAIAQTLMAASPFNTVSRRLWLNDSGVFSKGYLNARALIQRQL